MARTKERVQQDLDTVVAVFICSPERAFSRAEIVREVQQRDPSISEHQIENDRKRLHRLGYIRHETVGGPYEKRYIYTGKKWHPTQPTRSTHRRPCEPATLLQWRELQQAIPPLVSRLDDHFTSPPPVKLLDACRAEEGTAHAPNTTADGLPRLDPVAAADGSG